MHNLPRMLNKTPDRSWPLVPGDPSSHLTSSSPSDWAHLRTLPCETRTFVFEIAYHSEHSDLNSSVSTQCIIIFAKISHLLTIVYKYLFDLIYIKCINFSRVHKTFINVLTDSSKFQEGKKRRGMTWTPLSAKYGYWHSVPFTNDSKCAQPESA